MLAPVTLFLALERHQRKSGCGADDLRAADPGVDCGGAEVCQTAAGPLLGQYAALGDSFLENLQGLTTLKIYQADEQKQRQMHRRRSISAG